MPWPRDYSKKTFWSSSPAVPVHLSTTNGGGSTLFLLVPYIAERQEQGK